MSTKISSSVPPQSKGTVLLRHAKPKYSFMTSNKDQNSQNKSVDKIQIKATASNIVREKHRSGDEKNTDAKSNLSELTTSSHVQSSVTRQLAGNGKPVSAVTPQVQKVSPSITKPVSVNDSEYKESPPAGLSSVSRSMESEKPVSKVGPLQADQVQIDSLYGTSIKELQMVVPTSALSTTSIDGTYDEIQRCKQEIERLRKENESCKDELDVQLKVNSELKKLLIASVGEDLHHKVECLARTKAHLSLEVGDYTKKMYEDYENIDRISIEADMWRSKFFASRFMIDELARAKAFYASHYQESQSCIQQLLNERHELRNHMVDAYRCLQQIKSAFDPLNSQKSGNLSSANILDLSKSNQQISDAIKFRLLPGTSYNTVDVGGLWEDKLTPAESLAEEMLTREINLEEFHHNVPPQFAAPSTLMIERYHPSVKYDNITINCCPQCTGEMKAV